MIMRGRDRGLVWAVGITHTGPSLPIPDRLRGLVLPRSFGHHLTNYEVSGPRTFTRRTEPAYHIFAVTPHRICVGCV